MLGLVRASVEADKMGSRVEGVWDGLCCGGVVVVVVGAVAIDPKPWTDFGTISGLKTWVMTGNGVLLTELGAGKLFWPK